MLLLLLWLFGLLHFILFGKRVDRMKFAFLTAVFVHVVQDPEITRNNVLSATSELLVRACFQTSAAHDMVYAAPRKTRPCTKTNSVVYQNRKY